MASVVGQQQPPPQQCTCLGHWSSSCRWLRACGEAIGSLGEAVKAGALQPWVDVFCRKSTCGGLQPLPRVATRQQRRDMSIMTFPMSPLKRALLPRREVAVMVG
jgi:hypothetical protein